MLVTIVIGARRIPKSNENFFSRRPSKVNAVCPPKQLQPLLDGLSLCLLSKHFPPAEKKWIAAKLCAFFESLHAELSLSAKSPTETTGTLIESVLPPFPATVDEVELGPNCVGTNLLYNEKLRQVAVVVENEGSVRKCTFNSI